MTQTELDMFNNLCKTYNMVAFKKDDVVDYTINRMIPTSIPDYYSNHLEIIKTYNKKQSHEALADMLNNMYEYKETMTEYGIEQRLTWKFIKPKKD